MEKLDQIKVPQGISKLNLKRLDLKVENLFSNFFRMERAISDNNQKEDLELTK